MIFENGQLYILGEDVKHPDPRKSRRGFWEQSFYEAGTVFRYTCEDSEVTSMSGVKLRYLINARLWEIRPDGSSASFVYVNQSPVAQAIMKHLVIDSSVVTQAKDELLAVGASLEDLLRRLVAAGKLDADDVFEAVGDLVDVRKGKVG